MFYAKVYAAGRQVLNKNSGPTLEAFVFCLFF